MTNDQLFDREIHQPLPLGRTLLSRGMTIIGFALTAAALLPLLVILWEILYKGLPQLSLEALISLPAPVGQENEPNGFANAILGTLIMIVIACLLSVPFGLLTGIFLSEFAKDSAIASYIRFIVSILSSVPSIVVGVFAYGVIVLAFGFSALGGGFALGIIMLPIIALSTEEALKLVPTSQRLASAALGGGRLPTTFRIVVSAALPSITTGILLALSRAAGETAPLIFTALSTQFWPDGLLSPTPSLSVLIYNYAQSPFKEQTQLAWTASLVLIGLVLLSSILSRLVTRKRLENR